MSSQVIVFERPNFGAIKVARGALMPAALLAAALTLGIWFGGGESTTGERTLRESADIIYAEVATARNTFELNLGAHWNDYAGLFLLYQNTVAARMNGDDEAVLESGEKFLTMTSQLLEPMLAEAGRACAEAERELAAREDSGLDPRTLASARGRYVEGTLAMRVDRDYAAATASFGAALELLRSADPVVAVPNANDGGVHFPSLRSD